MPAETIDDQDYPFVLRFLARDESAFDELVARHQAGVYNLCLQMLGNRSDAEDAAQDVFVAVYKGLPGFRARSKVATWIFRIAVNKCLGYRKSRQAEASPEQDVGEWPPGADELYERRLVRKLIGQLPAHYRAVLVLSYYRELTCAEIAEVLEWSQGNVKCYLHRARLMFKKAYEQECGEDEEQ